MNRKFSPLFALALLGCGGKVDSLRDALVRDDLAAAARVVDAPQCARADFVGKGESACLSTIGRAFGSKHDFSLSNPDQADAATVALVLVRERRGDFVPAPETWLLAIKIAKGAGADALRLALATRMAELAPRLGKRIDDDAEAARVVHDLGTAIPGTCDTYAMLGDGVDIAALAPEKSPDHSPCVQKDLERRDGPGAAYGFGVWRAMEGILALWKEEARALRVGAGVAEGEGAKRALAAKLSVIDAATSNVALKKVETPGNAWGAAH